MATMALREDVMLDGIRVVSLAQQYPGPYCTMLLADLGADVILVEQPRNGDPARGQDGMSPFFAALNRNKRSVAIDLKSDEGKDVLWRLLATADVLVEGFRPGVMERLGFGADAVRARLPEVVFLSISGYGQDGPDSQLPGHDLSYQARAGLLATIDQDPSSYRSPLAIGDLSSAMFGAVGILAALVRKQRTGQGTYVDVSMTDGLVSWMGTTIEPALNGLPGRGGPGEPAYGVFRCADGRYLTLSIAHEDHFWKPLCDQLGLPGLGELRSAERRQRGRELRDLICEKLMTRSVTAWLDTFRKVDVPCSPVPIMAEVVADPQLLARKMFVEGPAETGGSRQFVAGPLKSTDILRGIRRPAPQLGEHTDEVLEELGYAKDVVETLRRRGVVGPAAPR